MAGGLIGLLDDVAALAKLAASSIDDVGAAAGRASAKAAGVVIDDTAVTPQYVHGLAAERELPIIRRIARGSLRNKLLVILPAVLLLSQFLPQVVEPILMLGGGFLCYEAVHKIWGALSGGHGHGHGDDHHDSHASHDSRDGSDGSDGSDGPVHSSGGSAPLKVSEDDLVAGAIRTDLILSAEIMVIALKEVASEPFVSRAAILVVVALLITVVVYGLVALLVRMDDAGLYLAERADGPSAELGRRLVSAMPRVLGAISVIGTAAMLWVGGHIELVGMHELGFDPIYDLVHGWEESIRDAVTTGGGLLAWIVNTLASAVLGLIVGIPLVAIQAAVASRRGASH